MVRAYAVFWRQKFKRLNYSERIERRAIGEIGSIVETGRV